MKRTCAARIHARIEACAKVKKQSIHAYVLTVFLVPTVKNPFTVKYLRFVTMYSISSI